MYAEDDLLPISALQHLLFCPRQCALIHVERLWAENSLTLEGRHLHEKADQGKGETRGRGRREEKAGCGAGAVRVTRALPLRSLELGLSGRADVVEFRAAEGPGEAAAVPYPVEYKRGKPKRDGSDVVQLCAQALCLEEMLGVPVPAGALFYGKLRRRAEVGFDGPLRELTLGTVRRLREMVESGKTPAAVRDKKCDRCSLRFLCLPDATSGSRSAAGYLRRSLGQALGSGPVGD